MIKSLDTTSIGSATIDLFFQGGKYTSVGNRLTLAIGGKYRAEKFTESLGGGGLNTAVGLRRLGLKSTYAGELSESWIGKEIIDRLKIEKVNTQFVTMNKINQSVSVILLGNNGERTIISYIAPNYRKLLTLPVRNSLKSSKWLFFCDHKSAKNYKLEVLKYAQRNNTKIALSLGSDELKKGIAHNEEYLHLSNIFFLNAHEIADLVKRKYEELELLKTNYTQILKTKILIVTDSKKGEYLYTKNQIIYRVPYPNREIKDTTGAGDAFATGFLYSYIKGKTFEESMDFGSKNAVSVIEKLGAQTGLLYA